MVVSVSFLQKDYVLVQVQFTHRGFIMRNS